LLSRPSGQQRLPFADDSATMRGELLRTPHIQPPSALGKPDALSTLPNPLSTLKDPPSTLGDLSKSTGSVEFARHPRARRYLIRVRADGSVRVTIPRRGSRQEAVRFYESQTDWVREQRARVAARRERAPEDLPASEKLRLQKRARLELPMRLLELAAALGLAVRKVSVHNQHHRWGSCSPSGHICLNWRLVTMPGWVRDYVLYHELMHLKRMDHSRRFWTLVAEVCPGYEEARRWLRRYGHAPHAAHAIEEQ
jgi:predicted metal-dependent hydrolase